jgi:hypothetical protein
VIDRKKPKNLNRILSARFDDRRRRRRRRRSLESLQCRIRMYKLIKLKALASESSMHALHSCL